MGVIDDLCDALARDTLAAIDKLGDESLIEQISKILAATSSTTQEAFMTSIRVRLSERRARKFLEETLAKAAEKPQ